MVVFRPTLSGDVRRRVYPTIFQDFRKSEVIMVL